MSMRRILVLFNHHNAPPKNMDKKSFDRNDVDWIIEYDVITNLKKLGHEVMTLALSHDLDPIKQAIDSFKPHIVFNLLVEFAGEAIFDQNVISYLELLGVPYTGCNPRSLGLARNKALTKKLLRFHDLKTPDFWVFTKGQPIHTPKPLEFPLIVKCVCEDSSLGISQASLVTTPASLARRINYLQVNLNSDVIVERFIEGRELFLGVMGNDKLSVFPPWELNFSKAKTPSMEFYHSYAKWNNAYRRRKGISSAKADLSDDLEKAVAKLGKKVYRTLGLNGYARVDFRLTPSGEIYVIEANPNPDLCSHEDFSASANALGIDYPSLLRRIVSLGLRFNKSVS